LKVYRDTGVDSKKLKVLQKEIGFDIVQAHELEQAFSEAEKVGRPFEIGFSTIGGPDMIAGDNLLEVERIIGKANRSDIKHVYSAYLNNCTYFLTNDKREFISGGKREKLKAVLAPLRICTLGEFIKEISV